LVVDVKLDVAKREAFILTGLCFSITGLDTSGFRRGIGSGGSDLTTVITDGFTTIGATGITGLLIGFGVWNLARDLLDLKWRGNTTLIIYYIK
jgi:hypothetical protein